jgi:excisionase family DNA binding protein
MSGKTVPDAERLLTPAEVAALFRVDPKTVTRWARDGRLTVVRTLGGHRRYRETEVLALLRAAHSDAGQAEPGQGEAGQSGGAQQPESGQAGGG